MSDWRSTDERQLDRLSSIHEVLLDIVGHTSGIKDRIKVMENAIQILSTLVETNKLILDEMACMRRMINLKLKYDAPSAHH